MYSLVSLMMYVTVRVFYQKEDKTPFEYNGH
ncbi:hypothetical protein P22_2116 [Propionispora sp. 2/2-37]|nr:hypothetical protein P22_2116 [Propionispora sp. 2/2-37]